MSLARPYFPGQAANPCGHFYPDVLRLTDRIDADGKRFRLADCVYCGRYWFHICCRAIEDPIPSQTELDTWRKTERQRLLEQQ